MGRDAAGWGRPGGRLHPVQGYFEVVAAWTNASV